MRDIQFEGPSSHYTKHVACMIAKKDFYILSSPLFSRAAGGKRRRVTMMTRSTNSILSLLPLIFSFVAFISILPLLLPFSGCI